MKLRLPISRRNLIGTFTRWAAELRNTDFITEKEIEYKDYELVLGAIAPVTLSAQNVIIARYAVIGPVMFWYFTAEAVTAGAAGPYLTCTTPKGKTVVTPKLGQYITFGSGYVVEPAAPRLVSIVTGQEYQGSHLIVKEAGANWAVGGSLIKYRVWGVSEIEV